MSAHQYGPIGFEQSGVQLLGSSEFYHLPVRIKYAPECRLGKVARLRRILQHIHGKDAQHGLTTRLVQEK